MNTATIGDSLGPANEVRSPNALDSISGVLRRHWGWLIAIGCSVSVFLTLHPSLLLANTTTAGGDTGAHFIVPYFAKSEIFSHGQIAGWSPIWYDGFPLFTFYFPLPSLVIAMLSYVIPYDVSFKLITLSGSLALPLVTYYLGRSTKLKEPFPALMAMGSLAYLFDRTYTIDGGNIASTLAGEYAFSFSLALGIAFLGVVVGGLHTKKRVAVAGLLYGFTAISHLLPAFFVAALAIVYVATGKRPREMIRLAIAGILGVAMIALWLVPFAENIYYTTSMGWTKVTTYVSSLAPNSLRPWIYLAILGAVISIYKGRRFGITIAISGVVSVIAFVVFPQGAVYNARMLPFYVFAVYILAALAVGELAIAGPGLFRAFQGAPLSERYGDGAVADHDGALGEMPLTHDDPRPPASLFSDADREMADFGGHAAKKARFPSLFGVGSMLVILLIGVFAPLVNLPTWLQSHVQASFVPSWAQWNYSGYEAKPGWPEYSRIMRTMSAVGTTSGCGRAMWEYNSNQNDFGTPMALMLLPYWTNGCIDSMEGLFFESSATTPYHFLNQSELSAVPSDAMSGLPYAGLNVPLGVRHLQLLGVRYYLAFSPQVKALASQNPNLKLIQTIPAVDTSAPTTSVLGDSWNVYRVLGSSMVQPLTHAPVVWKGMRGGKSSWLTYSVSWYQNPQSWWVMRAQSGPKSWLRINPGTSAPAEATLAKTKVTALHDQSQSLSFNVSRVGVPMLVKISYFPNWKAHGALGPYRVAPNLMVVIPTSHHVTMDYQNSTLDNVTTGLSVVVLVGLLTVAVLPRRYTIGKFTRHSKAIPSAV